MIGSGELNDWNGFERFEQSDNYLLAFSAKLRSRTACMVGGAFSFSFDLNVPTANRSSIAASGSDSSGVILLTKDTVKLFRRSAIEANLFKQRNSIIALFLNRHHRRRSSIKTNFGDWSVKPGRR
jgi:hypothetical protein